MEKQNVRIYSHLVCAVGIIVATVLLSAEPVFGRLMVRPMRINLTARPGTITSGHFELQNLDPNATDIVNVTLVDLKVEDRKWRIIEPDEDFDRSKLSSCKDWIKLELSKFEVGPLKSVPVEFTLKVTPGARGSYNAGIIATAKLMKRSGVRLNIRFLIPVLLDIQEGQAESLVKKNKPIVVKPLIASIIHYHRPERRKNCRINLIPV